MICRICKSMKISNYRVVNNYRLHQCKNCNVVFLDLTPSSNTEEFYDEKYFETYLYDVKYSPELFKLSASYYLSYLEKEFRNISTILDVGSGFGLFVKAFRELGIDADGVEISSYSVKIAKDRFQIDLYNCDLIDFSSSKKYDLITFYHSFEHLTNPVETLQKVKELLSSNGILWIALPNIMSLDRFIHKDKWNGWSLPFHIFHYSPKSIKYLLRQEGFKYIKIQKSFLNPIRLLKRYNSKLYFKFERKKYSKLKEFFRKPATFIFSGQNMNIFAKLN